MCASWSEIQFEVLHVFLSQKLKKLTVELHESMHVYLLDLLEYRLDPLHAIKFHSYLLGTIYLLCKDIGVGGSENDNFPLRNLLKISLRR